MTRPARPGGEGPWKNEIKGARGKKSSGSRDRFVAFVSLGLGAAAPIIPYCNYCTNNVHALDFYCQHRVSPCLVFADPSANIYLAVSLPGVRESSPKKPYSLGGRRNDQGRTLALSKAGVSRGSVAGPLLSSLLMLPSIFQLSNVVHFRFR